MEQGFEAEIAAELEELRADVRRRAVDRARQPPSMLDLPKIDVSTLGLPQVKALIAQRFVDGRTEKRLRALENRVAELEAKRG